MKKKIGRPPLPKGRAKSVQTGLRLSGEEDAIISRIAADAARKKVDWIRETILTAARPLWIVCEKWGKSDLHGKTVEFKLTAHEGRITAYGLGVFFVVPHRDGVRLAIQVHGPTPSGDWRVNLDRRLADCIERHPDLSLAEFRCFAIRESLKRLPRT